MHNRRFVFLDIEATGLNPYVHEIISIGAIVTEWVSPSELKIIEKFELKVIPENLEVANERSLRVSKFNPEDWVDAIPLTEAMKIFSKKTQDGIMVAHNVAFDVMFIERAFEKTGIPSSLHYHRLDTVSLAYAVLKDTDIKRYSLQYLCDHFGIVNTNAHTALADTEALLSLFLKLMNCTVVE